MLDVFLNRLFRRHGAGHRPAQPSRAERGVPVAAAAFAYRPALIEELEREHRALQGMFAALHRAHRVGDVTACIANLQLFTNLLRAHLLKEDLQLYRYLEHAHRRDRAAAQRLAALRTEMQAIGSTLSTFASAYVNASWDERRRRQLGRDLDGIGRILAQRIATEEHVLYPLYLPPQDQR